MAHSDAGLDPWVCTNCGFWQRWFAAPPSCPVCTDYRHPLPSDGWEFLDAPTVAASRTTSWREVLDGVWMIESAPAVGIGPAGWFVETAAGNVHWEGAGWTSDAALDWMASRGGVRWLSFSHSHVLGSAWRVAERFEPEVVVQSEQLPWAQALPVSWPYGASAQVTSVVPGGVADGSETAREGEGSPTRSPLPRGDRASDGASQGQGEGSRGHVSDAASRSELTLVHTGGHTPGHSVLHWAERRLVFCGDAFKFRLDGDGQATHVSTHRAYDAHIPLSHDDVRSYRETFSALDFDGVVSPWEAVPTGGKAAVLHLLDALLAGRPHADWVEIPGGPLPAAAATNANRDD